MPRYRALKPLPGIIEYRGGQRLLIKRYLGLHSVDMLVAAKDQVPYQAVTLLSGNVPTIDERLAHGFEIAADTPAHRIMASLARLGYLEEL